MAMAWMGGMPSVQTYVRTSMFFDKAEVDAALSRMEKRSLTKASLLVRRNAQKSIGKRGMARPLLKEMKANPGMRLGELIRQPGVTRRGRERIIERVRQIQERRASAAGTPPHTHVPYGHMLGFRRNLYNAYDESSHSAVVGPSAKGDDPMMPSLHEFGGTRVLRAWVLEPLYPRYGRPIITWVAAHKQLGGQWQPTGARRSVLYPPRPYMRPALEKSRPQFAKFFEGAFSAGVVGD